MEVGLDPGDFVLDGDPAPLPQKGRSPTHFSAHLYLLIFTQAKCPPHLYFRPSRSNDL